jgi:hypothetical protein
MKEYIYMATLKGKDGLPYLVTAYESETFSEMMKLGEQVYGVPMDYVTCIDSIKTPWGIPVMLRKDGDK